MSADMETKIPYKSLLSLAKGQGKGKTFLLDNHCSNLAKCTTEKTVVLHQIQAAKAK